MRRNALNFLIVIAFGVLTFIPQYGFAFLMYNQFTIHPLACTIAIAVWLLIFGLFLPISLKIFQRVSSLCIIVVFVTAFIALLQKSMIDFSNSYFWVIWIVIPVFSIIGWYMLSVPLWRSLHGVAPVQQTGDNGEEHHH